MAAAALPFKAEYAKSGRAGCKMCKTPIEKGSLRLAIMMQSRFHDGKDAHWFHSECFFKKHKPASVGDIEDYESLRYDDQKFIQSNLGAGGASATPGSSKGKGKGKGSASKSGGAATSEFSVGYAKSGKSKCAACEEFIPKDALRIAKKDYTSERAILYSGGMGFDKWHHLDCFVKIREELEFFVAASKTSLPGFNDLEREDQNMLKKRLPAISASKRKLEDETNDQAPSKKIKTESASKKEDDIIGKQNKQMYKYRDLLEEHLKKADWIQILTTNKQNIPDEPGAKPILDLVADIMTFGAMKKCADCKSGQFSYKSGVGYQCTGYINEFTKCGFILDGDVERVPFKVPNDLREHPVFDKRTFKVQKRIIPKHVAPVKGKVSLLDQQVQGPKINKKPLDGFKFLVIDVKSDVQSKMEKKIKSFGGTIGSKFSASIAAAIIPKDNFKDTSKNVDRAKKYGVPVLSEAFVANIKDVNYKLADEMSKYLLSDWVKDVRGRLKSLNEEFEKPRNTESILEKQMSSVKLKMKDGAVIDPQSGMDDGPYHVYKEGKIYYNCVLNNTSLEDGRNSFYKIQIIESDGGPKEYHVFRAWGRIGTTIGGSQTERLPSKQDAIDLFCEKYEEKTGNIWGRKFVKKPGRYISLDLDYGQKEQSQKLIPSLDNSQLPLPVQSLVSLIFDVDVMKRTMLEFEIDMDKMPLGKMSRKQLLEAYSVLSDSSNLRGKEKDDRKLQRLILDISNRFYTLIPHNFGTRMPPLLDNDELMKSKIEMLDSLMEIEIAYELLAKGDESGGSAIDSHYKTLSADIDIVEAHSEEFKIIEKYLANTHAPTHTNYALKIDQAFKVVRKGENKRFLPFKDLHNRRLLWHGSRVSNFAGIISQGLRIAPPEAPATGYMFGKGIYFADMVTKSANYCYTSRDNSTGLLLLCEVALGDMHELKQAKDIKKPPDNKHSVKGLGETVPDPNETHTFPDGVMVPYGKPTKSKNRDTALLYNEYIVYDIAQVNIKYLLRVDFKYGAYGGRR